MSRDAPARGRSGGSRMNGGDGPRFVAIAHDLRSPLNAIKSWTHVLEVSLRESNPDVKRALQGILAGVETQARLIEELLERPSRSAEYAANHPQKPESPGGRREDKDKGEADSLHKTTRRAER